MMHMILIGAACGLVGAAAFEFLPDLSATNTTINTVSSYAVAVVAGGVIGLVAHAVT